MKLVMILAAFGSALSVMACGGSDDDFPSVTPTATPSGPTPIPWIDSTEGPTLSPSPYPTANPINAGVRPCQGGDLTAAIAHTNGATGNNIAYWQFTNVSDSTCHLGGVPDIRVLDAAGQELPAVISKVPCLWEGDVQCAANLVAVLAPGGGAELTMTTPNVPPACPPTTATLAFELPEDGGAVPAPFAGEDSCVHIGIGRFVPIEAVTPTPLPEPSLGAALHLPDSVLAGTTLRFTVEISNNASEPFSFGELCPNYFILIDPQDSTVHKLAVGCHSLNCQPAPGIAPQGSVTFAMQVDIPEIMPGGTSYVDWMLNGTTYLVHAGGSLLQKTPYTITVVAASGVVQPSP